MEPPPPPAPRISATAAAATSAATPTARPPPPSDQMRATGTGRRKVALPPGRSQLDWIRNARALPRKPQRSFLRAELRRHASRGDAWMAVRGVVYDVTPYLEYHPGGVKIMMAGVGKDATRLFEKYHAWVNPEFMLERCVVGVLLDERGDGDGSSSDDDDDASSAEEAG